MTLPEAGTTGIVAVPRLPLNRLLELRLVLDRIMVALSSGEIAPTGGFGHEEAEALAIRLVHHTTAADRMAGASAREGTGTARSPSGGSKRRGRGAGRGIAPAGGSIMTKITTDHLARSAIVYVRQSTAYQVANNTESGRRQYGLVELDPDAERQCGRRRTALSKGNRDCDRK
jgi:hypothetical protein